MRKILVSWLFAVVLLLPLSGHALTADEIMKNYVDQFKVRDETNVATMTLVNTSGKERRRSITLMTKEYGGSLHKILIRFTAPENIRGAGLLIVENSGRSDDEWLFLPELKRIKKISTSERSHSFMGSEFSYEDLHSEVMKDYRYALKGSEPCGAHECFVIEAVPVSSRKLAETGYGKRVLWIRKDIFFRVKVDFYDRKGQLLKTETDEGLTDIGGGKYRMNKITMHNNKTGQETLLESTSRVIDSGIPATKFTTTYLKQGA